MIFLIIYRMFDFFLTMCIVVNAINMCFNNYSWRLIPGGVNDIAGFRLVLGNTITSIFIFEFTVKMIAMGFFFEENSYLSDSWNKLDFVVVITGYLFCSIF